MKFAHLIWCNLKRKKLRTALTLLSIVVAFLLFGFLAAIKQALTGGGVTMAGQSRLFVRHRVSLIQFLPQSYKTEMERIPGVAAATSQTWFGGVYQAFPKSFFMQVPVDPEEFLQMYPEIVLPADQRQAWLRTRTGAIVGRSIAKQFNWKVGQKVPIRSNIFAKKDGNYTWEFDIVGIYDGREKNTDTTSLFFRYDYFDEGRTLGEGEVGWYLIQVKDPSQAAEVAKRVDARFENSSAETKTEPEAAMIQSFVSQMGNIPLITTLIGGAVFFTILLVAGNTMSQAIRERIGELGAMKAIGFTNRQVLAFVMAEACLVAVLGGVLGLGLAWLVASGGDPTHGRLPQFGLPARDLLVGLGLSVALGLVTGIFPAWQATRLRVADALRRM